jgi:hypothetical protein
MASRFLVAGGDGNWNNTNNWASVSGGSSGASFPVAGDSVAFDSLSGNANMTVNVASACASLVMSGTYAGTLTFNSTLTLTSTCTFVAACTIAGTAGTLIAGGVGTYTSAGKILTCAMTFAVTNVVTLADSWTVNGVVTPTSTTTVNGNTLHCVGGLHATPATLGGSTILSLEGGTWDGGSTIQSSITIAGNVTISGGVAWGSSAGKTLTYSSGTVTVTGSTLTLASGIAFNLNTHGLTWNNVTFGGGQTYTLNSSFEWSGTLALNGSCTFQGAGTINGTGAITLGTSTTQSFSNTGGLVTTGTLTLPDSPITFAGTAGWTVGTLTTATLTLARIYTLTFGNTYRVTTQLTNLANATARQALKSSSAGNKVAFLLSPGASMSLAYCDPTDIDSSGGATIVSVGATLTNTLNWLAGVSNRLTSYAYWG